MRAKRILRAPSAMRSGALTLTLVTAVVVFGSVAAGALAAASGAHRSPSRSAGHHRRPSHHPRLVTRRAMASRLLVRTSRFAAPLGSTVVVHGLLKPGRRGATVRLLERAGRDWRTLAIGRTRRSGRFGIRYRVSGLGATIRVAYGGDRLVRAASAAAGRIVTLAPTVASWYYDQGNTACGFHATFGVANKTLPCGTKVTLSYAGRTVVATVDDRGPYVYGRSFDLNQNTARYLGMWGVGEVFASV